MTKPSVVICLFLSPLLAVAGCGGAATTVERPSSEITQPAGPPADIQDEETGDPITEKHPRELAGSEQQDDGEGTSETAPEAAPLEPEDRPSTEVALEERPEPNVPDLVDTPEETPVTEIVASEEIEASEPDPAESPEPETVEPNQPAPPVATHSPETLPQEAQPNKDHCAALDTFYQEYGTILKDYVLEDGRVDYGGLRRKRLRLKQLLSKPDELDPNAYRAWSQEDKLAFWINVYNLKMLEIIARNHPIQSSWWLRLTWPPSDIRHIGGIWSDYRFIVMDEEFTLGEVERRIFHRRFGDPRVYLAITYASRSSPRLRRTPYRGAALDNQLDEQVKAFLDDGKGLRIDRDKRVVYLSALFKPSWRGKEFVGRYAMQKKFKEQPAETRAVLNFLTRYISKDDVYFLEVENYTIAYTNFDWRINDSAKAN